MCDVYALLLLSLSLKHPADPSSSAAEVNREGCHLPMGLLRGLGLTGEQTTCWILDLPSSAGSSWADTTAHPHVEVLVFLLSCWHASVPTLPKRLGNVSF